MKKQEYLFCYYKKLVISLVVLTLLPQLLTNCSNRETDSKYQHEKSFEGNIEIDDHFNVTSKTEQGSFFVPDHPSNGQLRRILSLKKLINGAVENPEDEDVLNLFGLGWIEGYVIDRENKDIILFGQENPEWPNLTLDDLIVNIENVINNDSYPYCSLDPIPENVLEFKEEVKRMDASLPYDIYFNKLNRIWGGQTVVIGGVPRYSHHALIMLEADYHMKKVSQGRETIKPIVSSLDLFFIESLNELFSEDKSSINKPISSMSRYWFNVNNGNPLFQFAEGIVMIDSCDVVLLTEAQKSKADGTLYDSGKDNPLANKFAKEFSRYFQSAAIVTTEYSQLENLYRLQAILRAMKFKGHMNEYSILFNELISKYPLRVHYDIPDYYPGLVNVKKVTYSYAKDGYLNTQTIINQVNGGVSMEFDLSISSFKLQKEEELRGIRNVIIERNNDNRISWVIAL